jgi:type IV secretory pathway VirD2 relaxase
LGSVRTRKKEDSQQPQKEDLVSKSAWEKEDSRTDREVARREREEERARRSGSRARPQAARAYVRTARAPKGGVHIPTLWRGVIQGVRHFSQAPKEYQRRSIARVKYVANKQPGQWGAHGRYLAREGAQQEGGKGKGFDGERSDLNLEKTMNDWQMELDPRLWKVILSPEDGARLDLQAHTRAVMAEFAAQLSTEQGRPVKLQWVAIDHHNTENPHVHIAIRGVDGNGEELVLSPPQIQAIRAISAELATRELGYRSEHDVQVARDRDVTRNRWTRLDTEIEKGVVQLTDGRLAVTVEGADPQKPRRKIFSGQVETASPEQQRIARLQHLETLGLAEKIGARTWSLDRSWKGALKEMEVIRTRTQMLQEHRALLSDPRAIPVVTRLKPGDRLTGRVLGTGLDEDRDRLLVMMEGVDGRVHFVYENTAISNAREMGELRPESLVTLRGERGEYQGREFTRTVVEDHGFSLSLQPGKAKADAIPDRILEAEAQSAEDRGESPPLPQDGLGGFAAVFRRQMAEFLERRRLAAEKKRQEERKKAVSNEHEVADNNKGKGIGR